MRLEKANLRTVLIPTTSIRFNGMMIEMQQNGAVILSMNENVNYLDKPLQKPLQKHFLIPRANVSYITAANRSDLTVAFDLLGKVKYRDPPNTT